MDAGYTRKAICAIGRKLCTNPPTRGRGRSVRVPELGDSDKAPRTENHASLGTANKEAAAAKAGEIYHSLQANGWEAALAKFRPDATPALRANATVGDFIKEVKAKADGDPKTIEGYCRSLRKIVADIVWRGGELLRNPSGPVSRLTRI